MPTASLTQTPIALPRQVLRVRAEARCPPAKRQAPEEWCVHAFTYAATYGGKPWCYALVALNIVAENMTFAVLGRALKLQ
jgi:hypothetical protein